MTSPQAEVRAAEEHIPDAAYGRIIAAISTVKARYFRFVDTKQWDKLADLFTEDSKFFFPEVRAAPFSKAEILSLIFDSLHDSVSIHHGHMPEIELTSPKTACAIWPMEDRILYSAAATAHHGLTEMHGYGHYHEKYVLTSSGWMISELKLTRLHKIEVPRASDASGAAAQSTKHGA
jgi:hypothetical protein